jgi:hypothetical protein
VIAPSYDGIDARRQPSPAAGASCLGAKVSP